MKKFITWSLLFIPTMGWAQSGNFTMNVKAGVLDKPAKAYLFYRSGTKTIQDSASIVKGMAIFNGQVAEPTRADLIVDHHGAGFHKLRGNAADVFSLYLEKGNITVSAEDSIKNATVTGSEVTNEFLAYKKTIASQLKAMASVNDDYANASDAKKADSVFSNQLDARYKKAMSEIKAIDEAYIKTHPDSYVSLDHLNEVIGDSMDLKIVEPLFKSLSPRIQNSISGKQMAKLIESARATAIGAIAPEFTENDVNGKPVKLTDLRGKYVLIDFWASWCGPCRAENPNYVKAYKQYKDKNFTILGVSLDQPGKKDAWLAAIKKDGLEWTQVSDLQFWDDHVAKLYGIRFIPQNFLIDPNGKIIGSNLRGETLNKKLMEILK